MKSITISTLALLLAFTIISCGGGADGHDLVTEEDASEAGKTLQKWGEQLKDSAEEAAE